MRKAFKFAFLTALLLSSGALSDGSPLVDDDDSTSSLNEHKEFNCMRACEAQGDDPLECESTCILTAEVLANTWRPKACH